MQNQKISSKICFTNTGYTCWHQSSHTIQAKNKCLINYSNTTTATMLYYFSVSFSIKWWLVCVCLVTLYCMWCFRGCVTVQQSLAALETLLEPNPFWKSSRPSCRGKTVQHLRSSEESVAHDVNQNKWRNDWLLRSPSGHAGLSGITK